MTAHLTEKAAEDAKAGVASIADAVSRIASQTEHSFSEASKRFEKVVGEGLEQIKAQSRTYGDNAGEHLDEAQRYIVEKVKEKPLLGVGAALGVGVLVGLLIAGGRNNR